MRSNSKFGVALFVMAWALRLFFSLGMYVFFLFFVWSCYSHTKAYKIELLWTRIDVYCQNLIVLVVRSGYKVNLHFTKTSTKNKNFKSVWQQKVPWLRGIDAIAATNIPQSETTARIPHLSSEWSKFIGKQVRLRFLEKIIFGGQNYITATKLYFLHFQKRSPLRNRIWKTATFFIFPIFHFLCKDIISSNHLSLS